MDIHMVDLDMDILMAQEYMTITRRKRLPQAMETPHLTKENLSQWAMHLKVYVKRFS